MIIGKTPEEIRKHFHIKNDLPEKKGEKEKPKPDGATAAAVRNMLLFFSFF
jgi:hypothetical protein